MEKQELLQKIEDMLKLCNTLSRELLCLRNELKLNEKY